MTTYAENHGEQRFDWNAFLANPPKPKSEDHYYALRKADDWVTCACGNQCAKIPRHAEFGEPKDKILSDLGLTFAEDIESADWESAKLTLSKIEKRSCEILASL